MTTGSTPREEPPPPGDSPDDDLEDRIPCPDGACIGIVGPDGRCTECGRAVDHAGPSAVELDDDATDDEAAGDDGDLGAEGDDEERTPCPDGACIGIVGPDGRCTECGRTPEEIERVDEEEAEQEP